MAYATNEVYFREPRDGGNWRTRAYRNGIAIFILISGYAWPPSGNAFDRVQLTRLDYEALTPMCKRVGEHWKLPPHIIRPPASESEKALIAKVGGWHYCNGTVKLRRAELAPRTAETFELAKGAIHDINYSLEKINLKEEWAAEMLVARARALRILNKLEKAEEDLELAKKYHPSYAPIYLAMTTLKFDIKDYRAAVEILKAGIAESKIQSSELHYFLGLAYFYSGEFDAAATQEKIARKMGYPLPGLRRKLAEQSRSE